MLIKDKLILGGFILIVATILSGALSDLMDLFVTPNTPLPRIVEFTSEEATVEESTPEEVTPTEFTPKKVKFEEFTPPPEVTPIEFTPPPTIPPITPTPISTERRQETSTLTEDSRDTQGSQVPYWKTYGEPVKLINNSKASSPTWNELKAFLKRDSTDMETYSYFSYPCGAFAERLHNNAEALGIKTAWVAVSFTFGEDHALNAFETVDKGLVYIDCTGNDPSMLPLFSITGYGPRGKKIYGASKSDTWDKVAYVVKGRELGFISLDKASSPTYGFYESHSRNLDEYEKKVEVHNQEVEEYATTLRGRLFVEEPEYSRLVEWYDRLEGTGKELDALYEKLRGSSWDTLGVVSEIEMYW